MKRHQHQLTKMQRKIRSRRKTWTNALRVVMVEKNRRRMAAAAQGNSLMQRYMQQAAQEIAAEEAEQHTHTDQCQHDEAVEAAPIDSWLEAPLTIEEQEAVEKVETETGEPF
jgi:hypothetical protein